MFISQTRRNPLEDKAKNAQTIVQYDVNSGTINDNVRRKVEANIGNPLLANLKAKRGYKYEFGSSAPRFQEKKVEEAETFLGPGYYEQGSTFEQKGAGGSLQSKSQKFLF